MELRVASELKAVWPQSVFEKSGWTIFLVVGLGAYLHEPEDACRSSCGALGETRPTLRRSRVAGVRLC